MPRRILLAASLAVVSGCGSDPANPFGLRTATVPPSAEAALLFVSGSWAARPGEPRELFALNADGSKAERLTGCAQATPPCDFLQVAPSPDRARLAAIRSTPGAEAGARALYFMDLSRAVETILFPNRRVDSVDYAPNGGFMVYSALAPQTSQEDLFFSQPNGTGERALTETPGLRERGARLDPSATTAVYQGIDGSGVSRIYLLYPPVALTSGPAAGTPPAGTPFLVGGDADPVFSPDARTIAFRRLTGAGNGGLGTWDLLTLRLDGASTPQVIAGGPLFRGAPDWGPRGIVFVETDGEAARSELVLVSPDGTGRTVLRTEDAGYRMGAPRWLAGS